MKKLLVIINSLQHFCIRCENVNDIEYLFDNVYNSYKKFDPKVIYKYPCYMICGHLMTRQINWSTESFGYLREIHVDDIRNNRIIIVS